LHPLTALGWTDARAAELAALEGADLVGARVAAAHRGRLDLLTAAGPLTGRVAGRLRHGASSPEELPAVGDWVAADPATGVVHAVLPRRGGIARAAPDGRSEAQILAANVDVALLLGSLNRDLNVRRLERLLTLAADARAEAVVVLSKADLAADPSERVADVRRALGATVPVVTLSVHAATGLDALAAWLRPGVTAVLLGSSGVGKTTLLNALSDGPPARGARGRAAQARA
jgi:ribosome biogenesis GTPase